MSERIRSRHLLTFFVALPLLMGSVMGCQQQDGQTLLWDFNPMSQWKGFWLAKSGLWEHVSFTFIEHQDGTLDGSMSVTENFEKHVIQLNDIRPEFDCITFTTGQKFPVPIGGSIVEVVLDFAVEVAVDRMMSDEEQRTMALVMNDAGEADLYMLDADGQWKTARDTSFSKEW